MIASMARPSTNLRLFVAVYPPHESARAMLTALPELKLPPHRATPRELLHLTLQFIGATPAAELDPRLILSEGNTAAIGSQAQRANVVDTRHVNFFDLLAGGQVPEPGWRIREICSRDEQLAVGAEAGRGARGNAVYRDLVRTSLVVDARYLALGVMTQYRHTSGKRPVTTHSYREARDLIDAIYASPLDRTVETARPLAASLSIETSRSERPGCASTIVRPKRSR